MGGMVFGSLSAIFVHLVFFNGRGKERRVANDPGKVKSMFFTDVASRIVTLYSPVSKPESATV